MPRNQLSREPHSLVGRVAATACLALISFACATSAPTPDVASPPPEAAPDPVVLTPAAKRYLENVYVFACASEYIPYTEEESPPIPVRDEAARAERKQELETCLATVVKDYANLEAVRRMTWNGETHLMRDGEMKAIVRDGESFLMEYVVQLLARERGHEGTLAQAPPPPPTEDAATTAN